MLNQPHQRKKDSKFTPMLLGEKLFPFIDPMAGHTLFPSMSLFNNRVRLHQQKFCANNPKLFDPDHPNLKI